MELSDIVGIDAKSFAAVVRALWKSQEKIALSLLDARVDEGLSLLPAGDDAEFSGLLFSRKTPDKICNELIRQAFEKREVTVENPDARGVLFAAVRNSTWERLDQLGAVLDIDGATREVLASFALSCGRFSLVLSSEFFGSIPDARKAYLITGLGSAGGRGGVREKMGSALYGWSAVSGLDGDRRVDGERWVDFLKRPEMFPAECFSLECFLKETRGWLEMVNNPGSKVAAGVWLESVAAGLAKRGEYPDSRLAFDAFCLFAAHGWDDLAKRVFDLWVGPARGPVDTFEASFRNESSPSLDLRVGEDHGFSPGLSAAEAAFFCGRPDLGLETLAGGSAFDTGVMQGFAKAVAQASQSWAIGGGGEGPEIEERLLLAVAQAEGLVISSGLSPKRKDKMKAPRGTGSV